VVGLLTLYFVLFKLFNRYPVIDIIIANFFNNIMICRTTLYITYPVIGELIYFIAAEIQYVTEKPWQQNFNVMAESKKSDS